MNITEEALQYDLDRLHDNIERIERNIELYYQTIDAERREQERLRQMARVLEAKKQED